MIKMNDSIILNEITTHNLIRLLERNEKKESQQIKDMDVEKKIEEGRILLKRLFIRF